MQEGHLRRSQSSTFFSFYSTEKRKQERKKSTTSKSDTLTRAELLVGQSFKENISQTCHSRVNEIKTD